MMNYEYENRNYSRTKPLLSCLFAASGLLLPLIAQAEEAKIVRGFTITTENSSLISQTRLSDTTSQSPDRLWSLTLDSEGRPITIDGPKLGVLDTSTIRYSSEGLTQDLTNPLGHTYSYTYDAYGRPVSFLDPNGLAVTFEYGQLENAITKMSIGSESGKELVTLYSYDSVGRITEITLPTGRVVTNPVTSSRTNTVEIDRHLTDLQNRVASAQIGNHHKFRIGDKGISYLEKMLQDSSLLKIYNDNGQVVSGETSQGKSIHFSYDRFGNLSKIVDFEGVTTHYEYDGFSNLVVEKSADRGLIRSTYDEVGNLIKQTKAGGLKVKRTYDVLNRVTREAHNQNGEDRKVYKYSYDDCENGIGRLCKVVNDSETTNYKYTLNGTYSSVQVKHSNGLTETTRYSYNAHGQLEKLTYPTGLAVKYHYDDVGLIRKITSKYITENETSRIVIARNIKVDPSTFDLRKLTFGNGLKTHYTYAETDLSLKKVATRDRAGSLIDSNKYTTDDKGNIVGIVRLDSEDSQRFKYNEWNQLVKEVRGGQNDDQSIRTYSYDANGNRKVEQINENIINLGYDAKSNQLVRKNGKPLTYDLRGNLTGDQNGKRKFVYDTTNRLSEFSRNDELKASYEYNSSGQRIRKTLHRELNGDDQYRSIYFAYSPEGWLLSEYGEKENGKRNFARDYIWLGSRPIAQIERRITPDGAIKNAKVTYLHTDHLRTPRMGTNSNGTIVWKWHSTAFGEGKAERDPDQDGNKTIVRLRFPGQYYDRESKLFYNKYRDYDPKIGRYIQSDPIGLYGGINRYAYVGSNPLKFSDPLGLDACGDDPSECVVTATRVARTTFSFNNDPFGFGSGAYNPLGNFVPFDLEFGGGFSVMPLIDTCAATSTDVQVSGDVVTVTATVNFAGPGNSVQNRTDIVTAIQDVWTQTFPSGRQISTNISVGSGGANSTTIFIDSVAPGQGTISAHYTSHNNTITIDDPSSSNWTAFFRDQLLNGAGHEFGHVMGLRDRYNVDRDVAGPIATGATGQPLSGHENTLMGSNDDLTEPEVDRMVDANSSCP